MSDSANERPAVADVLDAVCEFVDRYIVFPSPASTRAVALFVATTWVAGAFDIAPYLLVTGPRNGPANPRCWT